MIINNQTKQIKMQMNLDISESQNNNSDSNQQHGSMSQKNKRRTRKDQNGRDYHCKCGKSYLSYPALYTHVKTKHDSKLSQFLLKNSNSNANPIVPHSNRVNHQDPEINNKQLFNKQDLEQLKMFLQKYFPERYRATPIPDVLGGLTRAERNYIAPLFNYWQLLQGRKQNNDKIDISLAERQNMERLATNNGQYFCADYVFGKFLHDMNKRVNSQCIKFLCRLIIMIRRGVLIEKGDPKYCQENTASMIPIVFNQLILNQHLFSEKYGKNPMLLEQQCSEPEHQIEPQPILQDYAAVCKVLSYFGSWLYNNSYTNYTVKIRQ